VALRKASKRGPFSVLWPALTQRRRFLAAEEEHECVDFVDRFSRHSFQFECK
jgi:hypothetical protein